MDPLLVIAGHLRRDYLLPAASRPLLDVPGGSLLYAASGAAVWEAKPGLLGRVGEDYPREWLRSMGRRGWDTRGVHITTDPLDLRYFQASLDLQHVERNNPVAQFARLGLTFPKSLLGYQPPSEPEDNRRGSRPACPRLAEIPDDYLNAKAVHLCPLEYQTATRLGAAFRQAGVTTLCIDPSSAYLTTAALDDVRALLKGVTAFLPSEGELRNLFWGQSDDLWQMAEILGGYGCEFIVIKCGSRGQKLYDSVSQKRWEIPAYPGRPADLTGAGDSFCGGFLAGYQQSYDPLRAVLWGNVSASLAIEGSGAYHALEAMPGLAQARLDSLATTVSQA